MRNLGILFYVFVISISSFKVVVAESSDDDWELLELGADEDVEENSDNSLTSYEEIADLEEIIKEEEEYSKKIKEEEEKKAQEQANFQRKTIHQILSSATSAVLDSVSDQKYNDIMTLVAKGATLGAVGATVALAFYLTKIILIGQVKDNAPRAIVEQILSTVLPVEGSKIEYLENLAKNKELAPAQREFTQKNLSDLLDPKKLQELTNTTKNFINNKKTFGQISESLSKVSQQMYKKILENIKIIVNYPTKPSLPKNPEEDKKTAEKLINFNKDAATHFKEMYAALNRAATHPAEDLISLKFRYFALLYSKPGTGKTYSTKNIAKAANVDICEITSDIFQSKEKELPNANQLTILQELMHECFMKSKHTNMLILLDDLDQPFDIKKLSASELDKFHSWLKDLADPNKKSWCYTRTKYEALNKEVELEVEEEKTQDSKKPKGAKKHEKHKRYKKPQPTVIETTETFIHNIQRLSVVVTSNTHPADMLLIPSLDKSSNNSSNDEHGRNQALASRLLVREISPLEKESRVNLTYATFEDEDQFYQLALEKIPVIKEKLHEIAAKDYQVFVEGGKCMGIRGLNSLVNSFRSTINFSAKEQELLLDDSQKDSEAWQVFVNRIAVETKNYDVEKRSEDVSDYKAKTSIYLRQKKVVSELEDFFRELFADQKDSEQVQIYLKTIKALETWPRGTNHENALKKALDNADKLKQSMQKFFNFHKPSDFLGNFSGKDYLKYRINLSKNYIIPLQQSGYSRKDIDIIETNVVSPFLAYWHGLANQKKGKLPNRFRMLYTKQNIDTSPLTKFIELSNLPSCQLKLSDIRRECNISQNIKNCQKDLGRVPGYPIYVKVSSNSKIKYEERNRKSANWFSKNGGSITYDNKLRLFILTQGTSCPNEEEICVLSEWLEEDPHWEARITRIKKKEISRIDNSPIEWGLNQCLSHWESKNFSNQNKGTIILVDDLKYNTNIKPRLSIDDFFKEFTNTLKKSSYGLKFHSCDPKKAILDINADGGRNLKHLHLLLQSPRLDSMYSIRGNSEYREIKLPEHSFEEVIKKESDFSNWLLRTFGQNFFDSKENEDHKEAVNFYFNTAYKKAITKVYEAILKTLNEEKEVIPVQEFEQDFNRLLTITLDEIKNYTSNWTYKVLPSSQDNNPVLGAAINFENSLSKDDKIQGRIQAVRDERIRIAKRKKELEEQKRLEELERQEMLKQQEMIRRQQEILIQREQQKILKQKQELLKQQEMTKQQPAQTTDFIQKQKEEADEKGNWSNQSTTSFNLLSNHVADF